jgi:long-chain acyl-CoA synthetase
MDEDGFVFVIGRIKELITKGNKIIAPREIDEVFYKHPAVQEAAAVGIPDELYGEEVMCCCVLNPGYNCTENELREFCRHELGEFKTPKLIKMVTELPRGPSGKLQRLKLREMLHGTKGFKDSANTL